MTENIDYNARAKEITTLLINKDLLNSVLREETKIRIERYFCRMIEDACDTAITIDRLIRDLDDDPRV